MQLSPEPVSLYSRLSTLLPLLERLFLAGTVAGVIALWLTQDPGILRLSLAALSITFFLYAFVPVSLPDSHDEPMGLASLLAFNIIPRITWINCAVATTGILFYVSMGEQGVYRQLLLISTLSIGAAVMIMLVCFFSGVKHLVYALPVFYRAVPLFLLGGYILLRIGGMIIA
jgi:hypothetical protein